MRGIKKLYGIAILLAILIGMPAHLYAAGGDIDAELPSNDGTDAFQVKDSLGIPLLRVGSGGKVGIGTALPNMKLEVRTATDGIATSGSTAIGGLRIRGATFANTVLDIGIGAGGIGNNTWLQATDATDLSQQYILSLNPNGGNVGIGTTNPGYKLDVAGTISSSSYLSTPYVQYFTVGGDFNTFYPVFFDDYDWYSGPFTLEITRPAVHEDSTWRGSLNAKFTCHGNSWGNGADFCRLENYNMLTQFIAGYNVHPYNPSPFIVWLRGGGTTYHYRSDRNRVTLRDATASSKQACDGACVTYDAKTTVDANVPYGTYFDRPVSTNVLCLSGDCRGAWPTVVGGANWPDITNKPAGFADNVDDVGIINESDPTVPANIKDGIDWTEVGGKPAGFADNVDNIGIDGGGTVNYLPKWTGSTTVGNSLIYDNGSRVGIGTSLPVFTLEVHGTSSTDSEGTIRIYKPIAPALILDSDGNDYRIVTTGSTSGNGSLRIDRGTVSGGLFNTYSADFVIGPTGNIGLGYTNPTYNLQVNGNSANTTGVWANISDARLKKDIAPLQNSLSTVLRLQGVSFRWQDPEKDKEYGLMRGFIAQDVEPVIPEWVKTSEDGYKQLEKVGVEAVLVEAIKELKAQKDAEIEELKTKNAELEARINDIENRLTGGK